VVVWAIRLEPRPKIPLTWDAIGAGANRGSDGSADGRGVKNAPIVGPQAKLAVNATTAATLILPSEEAVVIVEAASGFNVVELLAVTFALLSALIRNSASRLYG